MIRKPKIHFQIVLGTALLFLICIVAPASAADISSTSVTNPYITIDPIGNHTIGEVFFINGTTNLPVSENLTIDVYPGTPHRGVGGRIEPGIVVDRILILSGMNGVNHWSVNVTDGYWTDEEFIVHIWATTFIPEDPIYQIFTMLAPDNTIPIQITSAFSTPSPSVQATIPVSPVAPTSQAAPLSVILSVIAVFSGGIVFLNSIDCKKRK